MAGANHTARRPRRWWVVSAIVVGGFTAGLGTAWVASTGSHTGDAGNSSAALASDLPAGASALPEVGSIPEVSAGVMASTQPVPLPSSTFDAEQYSLDDPASPWVVVNKARPVSLLKYIPDDLVQVEGVTFADGGSMRREAADALADMKTAAGNAGVTFTVSSAFRDYARQSNLYSDYVSDSGVGRADRFSARPGYSEHQTGWAADLYDSTTCRLKACYGASESGKWVADHAAEYGFIVRYPEGKEAVTGYKYEPWHVRYVGMSLAERMRDEGVQTLEEFFGLPDAPAYQ